MDKLIKIWKHYRRYYVENKTDFQEGGTEYEILEFSNLEHGARERHSHEESDLIEVENQEGYFISKEQLEDLINEVDVDGYLLPLGRQQLLKDLGVE